MAPSRVREADGATYAATPTATDTLTAASARRTARGIGGVTRASSSPAFAASIALG